MAIQLDLGRMGRFWWVQLPVKARRLSTGMSEALVDGAYLVVWPRLAAIASPLALGLGLVIGWRQVGFDAVFSESMPLMVMAACLGVISAHLGYLFTAGFAVGNFFLWHHVWLDCSVRTSWLETTCSDPAIMQLARTRIPLLIEYVLLALLAVGVPVATKALLSQFPPPRFVGKGVWFGSVVVGHVVLTGLLVYMWAQGVPQLIRPVFTWRAVSPPETAMAPLQTGLPPLIVASVAASLVRMTLVGNATFRSQRRGQVDRWQRELAKTASATTARGRQHPLLAVVTATVCSTLLLSGVLQRWLDAMLFASLMFVLLAARARIIPVPLGRWPLVVYRLPLLLRLVAGTLITIWLAQHILPAAMDDTDTFRPMLRLLAVGLIIAFLLNPGIATESPTEKGHIT